VAGAPGDLGPRWRTPPRGKRRVGLRPAAGDHGLGRIGCADCSAAAGGQIVQVWKFGSCTSTNRCWAPVPDTKASGIVSMAFGSKRNVRLGGLSTNGVFCFEWTV